MGGTTKILVALALTFLLSVSLIGVGSSDYVEDEDATTQYTVSVTSTLNATMVSIACSGYTTQTATNGGSASLTVNSGETIIISATDVAGYTWGYWLDPDNQIIEYSQTYSYVVTDSQDWTAYYDSNPTYTYYLIYDDNGGSDGPSTQTASTQNTSYDFTVSSTEPTRQSYRFLGWSTSSSATSATYVAGDTITLSYDSSSLIIYAVWVLTPTVTYELIYDCNGGSGDLPSQTATSVSWTYEFTIWTLTPTRTDYTFVGWSENSTATSATYSPGDTVTLSYSNPSLTIYAVWSSGSSTTYSYHLYYDDNGGSDGPSTQSATSTSTTYDFTVSSTEPTRSDYIFRGWAVSSSATSATYVAGYTVTLSYDDPSTTLYAVWIPSSTSTYSVSVTGDIRGTTVSIACLGYTTQTATNGGSASLTVYSGESVTISATNVSGYAWGYWLDPDNQIMEYSQTYTYTVTDSQDWTAYFTAATQYTVSVTSTLRATTVSIACSGYTTQTATNGGSASLTVYSGESVTISATDVTGYTWGYWLDPDNQIMEYSQTYTYTVTDPQDWTAYYNPNTYTVTFDATTNGGTLSGSSTLTVTYGSTYGAAGTLPSATKSGYNFVGWFTATTGGVQITSSSTVSITTNTTLYAQFAESTYSVIIYRPTNGSISCDGTVITFTSPSVTYTFAEGTEVVFYGIPDTDYRFNEWTVIYTETADYYITSTTILSIIVDQNYEISASFADALNIWWDNGYINGSVNIAFNFESTSENYTHHMLIPLLEYDGVGSDSDGIDYFSASNYALDIVVPYNGYIVCTLSGGSEDITSSFKTGTWLQFTLGIDVQSSKVTFYGTRSMGWNATQSYTFTNYETVYTKEIFDWSDEVTDLAISKIYHEDVGDGSNHPRFEVLATTTFLDTYGFVMVNPTLNIYSQFPSYENLRLNLYSFAVYGDTLTINGHTFTMSGSTITDLYYTTYRDTDGSTHYVITSSSADDAVQYEATLNNIYVTWTNISSTTTSDRQCYLTFVNDNIMIEMGTYTQNDLTISGTGIWYFTTALYEPYTATHTTYSMDWGSWFNLDGGAFLMVVIGLLILLTVTFNIIWKPSLIDYAIIFGAGIITYVLVGGFL